MNNEINKAANICDAIGVFFENSEFAKELEGKGMFSMVSLMLREKPDACINLICAYEGISREEAEFDAKSIFGKMILVLKETMGVFQHFE